MEHANRLADPESRSYGPETLRASYRALEHGAAKASIEAREKSAKGDAVAAPVAVRIEAARALLAAKLEAVFDDEDASELLDRSRHPALTALGPKIHMVPRLTVDEATRGGLAGFVERGEPVVIAGLFGASDAHHVARKWTLDYLHQIVSGGLSPSRHGAPRRGEALLNVATDVKGRCCSYYEPRRASIASGYPYPFAPTTRLYRDTFGGFVDTMRSGTMREAKEALTRASQQHRSRAMKSGFVEDDDKAATRAMGEQTAIILEEGEGALLHYLHDEVMNSEGSPQLGGQYPPGRLASDLADTAASVESLAASAGLGAMGTAKLWLGQRGVVMPLHYDATDNLYLMAYGRKRVYLAPPDALLWLYRHPNQHPYQGSSQVNLSSPSATQFPRFARSAQLYEAVVGPSDAFFLPAWWWHQFEQPFEHTGSLNLWMRPHADVGSASESQNKSPVWRDARLLPLTLHDHLEGTASQNFGARHGIILATLARRLRSPSRGSGEDNSEVERANSTLLAAAEQWKRWADDIISSAPPLKQRRGTRGGVVGYAGFVARPAAALVREFLALQFAHAAQAARGNWKPGDGWDLSQAAPLYPKQLRERCRDTPESMTATFASICDGRKGDDG
ncbi:hypothetical protein AB1Y20_013112 [Prymnesium parvum]|uniref:JmjC domain-containing protein n=1 Tax=Prymnesium parvum TaxID=97485 RepID=A0AB34IKM2_PRYPA